MKLRRDLMTLVVIFILMNIYSFSAEISLRKYGEMKERSVKQKHFNPNVLNILGSNNFKEEIIQKNDNSMMISDEAKGEHDKNSKKTIREAAGNKKTYEASDSHDRILKMNANKEKLNVYETFTRTDQERKEENVYAFKANSPDHLYDESENDKQESLQQRDKKINNERSCVNNLNNNTDSTHRKFKNVRHTSKYKKKGDKTNTTIKENKLNIGKKPEFSISNIKSNLTSRHKSFGKINSDFAQILNEAKNEISNFSINIINNSFLTIDDIYSSVRKSSKFANVNKKLNNFISDNDLKNNEEIVNLIHKLKSLILKNEIFEIYLTHHFQKLNSFSAQMSIDDIKTLFQSKTEKINNIISEILSKTKTDKQVLQKKIKKLIETTSNYQKKKSSHINRKINLIQKGNSKSNISESFERKIRQNKSIKNEKLALFFGLNSGDSRDPFKISYYKDKKVANSTSLINNKNNEIKKIGSIILNAKNMTKINKFPPKYPIQQITNKFSDASFKNPSLSNKTVATGINIKHNKTNPHLNIAEKVWPQNLIREKESTPKIKAYNESEYGENVYKKWKYEDELNLLMHPEHNYTNGRQRLVKFINKLINYLKDSKHSIENLPFFENYKERQRIFQKFLISYGIEYNPILEFPLIASDNIKLSAKSKNNTNEHKSKGFSNEFMPKNSKHLQAKESIDATKFAPKILNNFDTNGIKSLSNHIQKKGSTLVIKYNPEVKSTRIQHPQSIKRVINSKNSHLYFGLSPLKKYEISEIFYGFIKGLNKDLSSWFEREKDELEVDAGLVINCLYNNSEFLSFYDESVQYIKSDTFENLNISLDSYISFKEVASKIYGFVTPCSEKYAQINKSLSFLNFSTIESFIIEDIQKVDPNISEINGTLKSIRESLKYKRYEDIGKAIGRLLNKIFNLTAPVIEEYPYKPPRIITPKATGFPERNAPSHPNRRMEHMGPRKGHFFGVSSGPEYREQFKRILKPHMAKIYSKEIRENINMLP